MKPVLKDKKATWNLQQKKAPEGLSDRETRFSVLRELRINCLASVLGVMSGENQALLITCPVAVKHCAGNIRLVGFSQQYRQGGWSGLKTCSRMNAIEWTSQGPDLNPISGET